MSSYSVPENIRAMKPKGTMVKSIHGKYYVYEYFHVKENDKWKLDITITDRYDFTDFKEIDEYCDDNILKGLLGSTANNMAMISVASGVMHEYNVTIKFQMDWDDENE